MSERAAPQQTPAAPIAVFASGRGSNFIAIARAVAEGRLQARITALVSDKPGARAIEAARGLGIPVIVVEPEADRSLPLATRRERHEARILEALAQDPPRFLILAGYMRLFTPAFIERFRSERGYARIVNIHPSLLPAFPGTHSYAQAFRYGAKITGVTVHFIDTGLDDGPICAQESLDISACASVEEVERRGLEIENRLYPEALKWILPEKFDVEWRDGAAAAPFPDKSSVPGPGQAQSEVKTRRLSVRPN